MPKLLHEAVQQHQPLRLADLEQAYERMRTYIRDGLDSIYAAPLNERPNIEVITLPVYSVLWRTPDAARQAMARLMREVPVDTLPYYEWRMTHETFYTLRHGLWMSPQVEGSLPALFGLPISIHPGAGDTIYLRPTRSNAYRIRNRPLLNNYPDSL